VTENRPSNHRLIQIFNRYLEPGGEEAWVRTLEESLGLPTCYLNSSDWVGINAPPFWSQAVRMINNPDSLRTVRDFQHRHDADAWIIHNAFPVGSAALYREAQRNEIPLIQYTHNFRPFALGYLKTSDLDIFPSRMRMYLTEIKRASWQGSRLKTAWLAAVYSFAGLLGWFDAITAWIAVSDFMRDQLITAGVAAEKIFTLRHFWKLSTGVTNASSEEHYLFIGRIVEMKGVLVLLDVWERIRAKNGDGPRLVIVGDGPLAPLVESRAKKNPLVTFRGIVRGREKADLFQRARAIIAPSLCLESLGLVAYEAYDFGKPILAARAGGLGEIVVHNQTGLLHEPGDVATLHEQVMSVEGEPQVRAQLGRNGREWLLENANEETWRRKFNDIIEFAVAAKRKR